MTFLHSSIGVTLMSVRFRESTATRVRAAAASARTPSATLTSNTCRSRADTRVLRNAKVCRDCVFIFYIFKTVLSSGYILILLSIENILASLIETCQGWSRMRNVK